MKRSERGLISLDASPTGAVRLLFVVAPTVLVVILVLCKSAGRRYDAEALAVLPVMAFAIVLLVVFEDVVDSRIDFLEMNFRILFWLTFG